MKLDNLSITLMILMILSIDIYSVDCIIYSNKENDIIYFYGDILCRIIYNQKNYLNIIIRKLSYVPTYYNNLFSDT